MVSETTFCLCFRHCVLDHTEDTNHEIEQYVNFLSSL